MNDNISNAILNTHLKQHQQQHVKHHHTSATSTSTCWTLTSQPAPATPHQKKPARPQLFGISPSQEPSSQMHHSCLRNFRTEQLSFLKFLKCHHFSPLAWVPSLAKLKGKFSLIFLVLLKISFWKFRYCHLELEHALGSTYFSCFFPFLLGFQLLTNEQSSYFFLYAFRKKWSFQSLNFEP